MSELGPDPGQPDGTEMVDLQGIMGADIQVEPVTDVDPSVHAFSVDPAEIRVEEPFW
jgi:hypothetical protein